MIRLMWQWVHRLKQRALYASGLRQRGPTLAYYASEAAQRKPRVVPMEGRLYAEVRRADGKVEDLGCISERAVTDAFVQFVVDVLQGTGSIGNFRWHGSGIGTASEQASDTVLGNEVASRVSGSQVEGGSPNIYRTVGVIPYSGSFAITEHGLFNAGGGGTLCDRSVFGAINVGTGDSIQFTFELTLPSGS